MFQMFPKNYQIYPLRQIGIENLRKNVDSLIVVNNNKLREVYGNLGFKAGFSNMDLQQWVFNIGFSRSDLRTLGFQN